MQKLHEVLHVGPTPVSLTPCLLDSYFSGTQTLKASLSHLKMETVIAISHIWKRQTDAKNLERTISSSLFLNTQGN